MDRKNQEKENLRIYPCPESAGNEQESYGILLSDEIEYYVKTCQMIAPFCADNLKPASYELTVGDEYSIKGEIKKLTDESGKNIITIEPFEVVIIRTREVINLPRFIIGRWNIRVKRAYEGLLWVGGPQVDPGWVGRLSCPLYNLSHESVTLKLYDPIAVIDFAKTTPFTKHKCVEYQLPKGRSEVERQLPSRILFEDYAPEKLQSALYTEAKVRIDEIAKSTQKDISDINAKVTKVEDHMASYFGIILGALAIMVAAMAIFFTSNSTKDYPHYWYTVIGVISIVTLIFSLVAFNKVKNKSDIKHDKKGN